MTDEPRGLGWWQASDLKWYPPEKRSRGSVPHVRHAAMAVIRPSADPGPQRFQGALRIGGQKPHEQLSVAMKKSPLVAKWRSPLVAR